MVTGRSIIGVLIVAFVSAGYCEPTGCPDFKVELPRAESVAATVKAVDFGFSEKSECNNMIFRNNKVVSDDPAFRRLSYAGRVLVEGGENNQVEAVE